MVSVATAGRNLRGFGEGCAEVIGWERRIGIYLSRLFHVRGRFTLRYRDWGVADSFGHAFSLVSVCDFPVCPPYCKRTAGRVVVAF